MKSSDRLFDRICLKFESIIAFAENVFPVRFFFSIIAIIVAAILIFQILNVSVVPENAGSNVVDNEYEILQNVSASEMEFKDNHGMITVCCPELTSGGVYVFVNNTIKVNLTNSDSKNLRVKVGDIIVIKGHGYSGEVTVSIKAAIGNINTEIVGKSKSVGTLGKFFVEIS